MSAVAPPAVPAVADPFTIRPSSLPLLRAAECQPLLDELDKVKAKNRKSMKRLVVIIPDVPISAVAPVAGEEEKKEEKEEGEGEQEKMISHVRFIRFVEDYMGLKTKKTTRWCMCQHTVVTVYLTDEWNKDMRLFLSKKRPGATAAEKAAELAAAKAVPDISVATVTENMFALANDAAISIDWGFFVHTLGCMLISPLALHAIDHVSSGTRKTANLLYILNMVLEAIVIYTLDEAISNTELDATEITIMILPALSYVFMWLLIAIYGATNYLDADIQGGHSLSPISPPPASAAAAGAGAGAGQAVGEGTATPKPDQPQLPQVDRELLHFEMDETANPTQAVATYSTYRNLMVLSTVFTLLHTAAVWIFAAFTSETTLEHMKLLPGFLAVVATVVSMFCLTTFLSFAAYFDLLRMPLRAAAVITGDFWALLAQGHVVDWLKLRSGVQAANSRDLSAAAYVLGMLMTVLFGMTIFSVASALAASGSVVARLHPFTALVTVDALFILIYCIMYLMAIGATNKQFQAHFQAIAEIELQWSHLKDQEEDDPYAAEHGMRGVNETNPVKQMLIAKRTKTRKPYKMKLPESLVYKLDLVGNCNAKTLFLLRQLLQEWDCSLRIGGIAISNKLTLGSVLGMFGTMMAAGVSNMLEGD